MTAWAKPVDNIEAYGVYVVAEKGFVKIEPYGRTERYVDFKYLNEVPYVKRADQTLKVIVYQKKFDPNSMVFELRPISTTVDIRPISFNTKPLSKTDMYELTLDKPVENGTVLQVNANFYSDNFGAIMLGEPQAELVKYFSRKDLTDAPIVKQYVDDARVAFPKSAELKTLAAQWDKAAKTASDKKAYSYVEEKWKEYQQTEKISLKARYLNDLVGEINTYLNDHPNGSKADEAKQRKKHAEVKLKEYEKQL